MAKKSFLSDNILELIKAIAIAIIVFMVVWGLFTLLK